MKKILASIFALSTLSFAQVRTAQPPLQVSGTVVRHLSGDGQTHVPKSFGVPPGYQLTTNGGSGDAYWGPGDGFYLDSMARRHAEVTGLWRWPTPCISISGTTTFDLEPVDGQIVNSTSVPGKTRVIDVHYPGGTNITATHLAAAPTTYLLIDSNSTLIQQTTIPTIEQRREMIFLGVVAHPALTAITSVDVQPDISTNLGAQFREYASAIRYINEDLRVSPNGANLKIDVSAGHLHGLGIGWAQHANNPMVRDLGPYVAGAFRYRNQTGGTGPLVTDLDPTTYDAGGVTTPVGGGVTFSTNQFVYIAPDGQRIIMRGQFVYLSLDAAVSNAFSESRVIPATVKENLHPIGIISLTRGVTSGLDSTQIKFLTVSKFGDVVGGTGGATTANLQGIYNNSSVPQILTDATREALTIQRGSASDTDAVFRARNGAGANTARINGDGSVAGTKVTATGGYAAEGNIIAGRAAMGSSVFGGGSAAWFGHTGLNDAGGTGVVVSPAGQVWLASAAGQTATIYGSSSNISVGSAISASAKITMPSARISGLTASKLVKTDASKDLVSGDVLTADITDRAVTFGKMLEIPANTFAGNSNVGADTIRPITISEAQGMLGIAGGPFIPSSDGIWYNDLKTASGTLTLEPLIAGGILKATASTGRVALATAPDFPTLNQNTTGSAAKWTTPRTLTIGSTGKAVDGSADVAWSLAEIGAAPAHSVANNTLLKSDGAGGILTSQITDDGTTVSMIAGKFRQWTGGAGYAAIYGSGIVTPSNTNPSYLWSTDGNDSRVNGGNVVYLTVGGAAKLTATSDAVTSDTTLNVSSGALQVGSVDIVTAGRAATNLTSVNIYSGASDGIGGGSYIQLGDTAVGQTKGWVAQLGASNTYDLWSFASGAWTKRASVSATGVPQFSGLAGTGTRMATLASDGTLGSGALANTTPQALTANTNIADLTSTVFYINASGLSVTIPSSGITPGSIYHMGTPGYSVTMLFSGVTVWYAGATISSGFSLISGRMFKIVCLTSSLWMIDAG